MFGLGIQELLITLIISLLVFGAGRLPEIGSGLGKAIRGFKEATSANEAIDASQKNEGNGE
jgi:sec-independent protein translocase protein TatA